MTPRIPARARASCLLVAAVVALALTTVPGGASGAPAQVAAQNASAQNASAQNASAQNGPRERAANVVTPGDFTGYGFDQCHAPGQKAMNRWLKASPFLSVGIYISGDSRACRSQPNLTPTWIAAQLRRGWRLLPITLGPQASCQPRFPRYDDDFKISPKPGRLGNYAVAKRQGRAEAVKAVEAATALGIAPKSTLWYDLEGFDAKNTHCRESALTFLSGWTQKLHALGFVSGVYSSAGSGIAALDSARVNRPDRFTLPDMIWVARWDGIANTSTSYIREDGWRPGGRVKQYQGGHDETWGGVTINIDRNFLDVGRGSVAAPETHCGGVRVSFLSYPALKAPAGNYTPAPALVKALQCLLKERGYYGGRTNGSYNARLVRAMNAWQTERGLAVGTTWYQRHWMTLLAAGDQPILKFGSAGPAVRRLQRTLNAAAVTKPLRPRGVFNAATNEAVRAWQAKVRLPVSGVITPVAWTKLAAAAR